MKRLPVVETACRILHNLCERNVEHFDSELLQGVTDCGSEETTQEMAPVQQQQTRPHATRMAFTTFFSQQGQQ